MPTAIEQHADCFTHMRQTEATRIEATDASRATLLPMPSSAWYLGAKVPGKPRVFMPYAGGIAHYAEISRDVVAGGHPEFTLS